VLVKTNHNENFENFKKNLRARQNENQISMPHWTRRRNEIVRDALVGSRFDFLRWPSLAEISPAESTEKIYTQCYKTLCQSPDWNSKWFKLTRENKLGRPQDLALDMGTSPILIQHAFHLLHYERCTKVPFLDCDMIFEVGGGYGSFCRLLRAAGFRGLHIIYDLPEVSEVQRLFLRCSGIPELETNAIRERESSGFCLLTDSNLELALNYCEKRSPRLAFVATWSLSEAPIVVRNRLFPRLHRTVVKYLISYEQTWEGLDNDRYFDEFRHNSLVQSWVRSELPGSRYLIA
jgi:hypothetical protein